MWKRIGQGDSQGLQRRELEGVLRYRGRKEEPGLGREGGGHRFAPRQVQLRCLLSTDL